ncbi:MULTISPECIES: hypothetical protein [Dictyoglomus]|jgi:hypothetical protein|uniref:Uncharacterized protein n=1 Tax=Dictyoglomus turgidum (strain DSM 6724 / Z-1310) TaxID=515635 RepID=B8DYJ3_DICTD|nr:MULTISPECIES: hypothetical protein [Dictyoglomus]ACK41375.1 conserved hypothetical protein [Dictyoglomus turgidum DSM 6724]PNV80954.1 MAG: hypothetical protein C0196_00325 [Dictyoglomus turgidum]HBU31620.1 hypothetical protein [Dictyoglomus sp.]
MKKILIVFALLITLLLLNSTFATEVDESIYFDAKSSSLGFTFVTLDSEGETYFFNPATLSLKKFSYFSLTFDNLTDNPNLKLSYFYPSTTIYSITADLILDKNTKEYSLKNIRGAIAFPLTSYIYLGTSAMYLEEENLIKGDIGLMIKIGDFLRTGIVGEGFTIEKISDQVYKITLALRYNIGLSFSLFNNSTNIYLDLIDVENFSNTKDWSLIRFGIEQKLGNILVIRIGSKGDITNLANYTFGLGINLNRFSLSISAFSENIENSDTSLENIKLKYKLTGTLRF